MPLHQLNNSSKSSIIIIIISYNLLIRIVLNLKSWPGKTKPRESCGSAVWLISCEPANSNFLLPLISRPPIFPSFRSRAPTKQEQPAMNLGGRDLTTLLANQRAQEKQKNHDHRFYSLAATNTIEIRFHHHHHHHARRLSSARLEKPTKIGGSE